MKKNINNVLQLISKVINHRTRNVIYKVSLAAKHRKKLELKPKLQEHLPRT